MKIAWQVAQPDLAVVEVADDEGIQARHYAGLGRGKDAAQDAAEDDDAGRAAPARPRAPSAQRAPLESAMHHPQLRVVGVVGVHLHLRHQEEPDQQAGNDAAEEQAADGNLRDGAVNHHRHAGRDDGADGAGASRSARRRSRPCSRSASSSASAPRRWPRRRRWRSPTRPTKIIEPPPRHAPGRRAGGRPARARNRPAAGSCRRRSSARRRG